MLPCWNSLKAVSITRWQSLTGDLARRAYVLGQEPTIVDLSLVGYMYYPAEEFGFDIAASYRNIDAWLNRIKALPNWAHPYDLTPLQPLPD